MGSSTLITDYLGEGTHAARPLPATIAGLIPPGGTAFYAETDTGNTFVLIAGAWVQVNGGGGGGSLTAPVIRGHALVAVSASSYTVAFPSGTVAGDVAFVFVGHGYQINPIQGWAQIDNQQGSQWNGATFAKELQPSDISTGSVTVTVTGGYDGIVGMVVIEGQPGDFRPIFSIRESSGQSVVNIQSAWGGQSTDLIIVFGSTRESVTPTVTPGTLLQTANTGANATGIISEYQPSGAGGTAFAVNYTAAGSGDYTIALTLKALGGP